ncbi:glycosyltransferase [Vibrio lamellibrachiae]|uniref:glycosyltransferase n=1 Tax=Vibrio lamellibrachiae TaxID=2910253 RepID=UPI003D124570
MKVYNFLINNLSGGGAERVLTNICTNFSKQSKVRVFLLDDNIFYELPNEVEVILLSKTGVKWIDILISPFILTYYSYKFDIKILQSHLFISNYVNSLSKVFGARHQVQMVHCVSFSSKFKKLSLSKVAHLLLMKILYGQANLHIFKSEDMNDDYTSFLDIPEDKCKVIYNPVNIENIRRDIRLYLHSYPIGFNILIVGRFHATKRQYEILELLEYLPDDVNLHFLGDGPLLEHCKTFSKTLNGSDRVHFYGSVDNPFGFMASADIVLSNSVAEGFPNTLVEALACGACCIHADCLSGPREILNREKGSVYNKFYKSEFGILFDQTSEAMLASINVIYSDEELKRKYQEAALTRALDFDYSAAIRNYKHCFEK